MVTDARKMTMARMMEKMPHPAMWFEFSLVVSWLFSVVVVVSAMGGF